MTKSETFLSHLAKSAQTGLSYNIRYDRCFIVSYTRFVVVAFVVVIQKTPEMDGLVDGLNAILCLFNSISVLSERLVAYNERLCNAMESHL